MVDAAGYFCASAEASQPPPAGLMQMIGDTGWQLSHGERSRLFMARALLQEPDLLIVDEGLGALDSETQAQCLDVLLEEARALILISHL